jgi:NAD(P)-dependent dehydrogenase (short-subunit alcohol dehydrogenase family)
MNTNHIKTVIVTGASSGIGLAIARAYLARGYNVVGNARTMERLEQAAAELGNPKNFLPVAGDIGSPATAAALFDKAISAFGRADILVNNAGIYIAKPVDEYSVEDFDAIIGTNVKGFFFPTQRAVEHMRGTGGGQIINITAAIALQPNAKVPAVLPILIKGGLNQATRGLAIELAGNNIRVNAVAPGIIATPLHGNIDAGTHAFLENLAPTGVYGNTDDVVNAVLYLTDAPFVTGTVMAVDGGGAAGTW